MFELENDPNMAMVRKRYENRDALGAEWLEKRKLADKHRTLASGEPNPMYPRYALEEQVARLSYDMAFLVEQNRILAEQNLMMSEVYQRMGILEGAYSHLMTMAQGVKLEYYNKLKKIVDKPQPKGDNDGRN